ncbi:alpha-ketoglutarate-dependent dioxygenase alkB homolog 3 [Tachysurus vachellii]|uniref:alpha-ketoglutarate-dependent dioxygenase alkB homolog 3 n=1 Tax=Tachysurus vachellii TaxID=175792 RepID=UPI00296B20A1|nr:alpha-ketoglutarate-dependent dioxygenase alkB homolog 3 [Tachysurus vachellii]
MADKRQRVQGSWAKATCSSAHVKKKSGSWKAGPVTYEFNQPAEPIRVIPVEKVIEDGGVYVISEGPTGESRLRLFPGFLPLEQADWMFSKLLAELPWSLKTNYGMMGEAYEEPRLTCWFGELPYTYSRSMMQANPQWHPILLNLRQTIEQETSHTFNSVLCNLYRDGKDSIAWHSDDELSLGPQPIIASLSLGDMRVFSLRKKLPPGENRDYTYAEKVKIPLSHGTLLIMEGCTQDDWQHQVAKEYHDRGPRVNLTFRTIFPEPVHASKR